MQIDLLDDMLRVLPLNWGIGARAPFLLLLEMFAGHLMALLTQTNYTGIPSTYYPVEKLQCPKKKTAHLSKLI